MSRRLLGVPVDGVHGALVGDVHLPDDPAPAPAIVVRTPYGREGFAARGAWWAARGWAYVVQDVAGRHDSEGSWEPYAHEREDGGRTVDAVRRAQWCDGRVVVAGASYSAFCAWQAALARPDAIAAVVSEVPALGPPRTTRESGGVPRLGDHAAWWLRHGDARTSRSDAAIDGLLRDAGPDPLRHAPATQLPARLGVHAPRFAAVLASPPGPGPLEPSALAALPMPTLHVAGLLDLFLQDATDLWSAVGTAATPPPVADLVVGPWGHALDGPGRHERTRAWLEVHVGGRAPGGGRSTDPRRPGAARAPAAADPAGATDAGEGPTGAGTIPDGLLAATGARADGVRRRHLLPIGARAWRTTSGPARTTPTTLVLGPGGRLLADPPTPAVTPAGWIAHDPTDPVRSSAPGADRRTVDGPPDGVARWRSAPFADGGELDGQARLLARAEAEPAPTDWIAHLELHRADGSVLSLARTTAVVQASPAMLDLRFPPVAAVVPPGSAIGLTLAAADHPDLLLHPRTTEDRVLAVDRRPGRQRLQAHPERAARLVLPLRPTPGPR